MEKRERIIEAARTLFAEKGYKKTNVAMITKAAGLATGTYYLYFKSKDSLFMEIYQEENAKLKKEMMFGIDRDGQPMEVMSKLMALNYEGMLANPILKHWYNRESFAKIEANFKKEKGLDDLSFMNQAFVELIEHWQETGKMRSDMKSDMIMAMFQALIQIDLNKESIGIQFFPELVERMSEFVMMGLERR